MELRGAIHAKCLLNGCGRLSGDLWARSSQRTRRFDRSATQIAGFREERSMIKRRTVLKGLAATGAAAVYGPAVLRAQAAPFKIGLLTVKTGPLAQGGIQMEQGIATLPKEKSTE